MCISPSLLKSKFQNDYYEETRSEHFRFQSASFVYTEAKESHPMHGAVIFRMKGKCTFLKRALSQFETRSSKLKTQSSRRETLSSKVSRIENRVSRDSILETRVTVNLPLSGTVSLSPE